MQWFGRYAGEDPRTVRKHPCSVNSGVPQDPPPRTARGKRRQELRNGTKTGTLKKAS